MNEVIINENNFEEYFFDVRKHKPKHGQVMARYAAVAEFVDGMMKKNIIDLLKKDKAIAAAGQRQGFLKRDVQRLINQDRNSFAASMVTMGEADGMVSGAVHSTAHTIRPSFEIIKTKPDAKIGIDLPPDAPPFAAEIIVLALIDQRVLDAARRCMRRL